MLADTSEGRFGFVVDKVLGNCQTVIKSLGKFYRQVQIVSGATILGNGSVALILDPDRLIQEAIREESRDKSDRSSRLGHSSRTNNGDFMALAGKGSAGPSASARM
jgi:chemotaxis protein histidine kinase CheA